MQTVRIGPAPRLAVSVAGSGPFILFLHGIGGRRQDWDAQLAFFSRDFEAAWDARGYGDSEDYEGALDFGALASDVARVLDCFGAQAAHLVGISMGGRIACSFAWRHPERVRSLTFANSGPSFGAMTPEQVASLVERRLQRAPEAQAARMLMPGARPDAYRNALAALKALRRDSYAKAIEASVGQDVGAPLEEITASTLVIGSRHDSMYPVSVFRDIASRMPSARLLIIEDAGHLCNLEQPERFNHAVADFLAALGAKPRRRAVDTPFEELTPVPGGFDA